MTKRIEAAFFSFHSVESAIALLCGCRFLQWASVQPLALCGWLILRLAWVETFGHLITDDFHQLLKNSLYVDVLLGGGFEEFQPLNNLFSIIFLTEEICITGKYYQVDRPTDGHAHMRQLFRRPYRICCRPAQLAHSPKNMSKRDSLLKLEWFYHLFKVKCLDRFQIFTY